MLKTFRKSSLCMILILAMMVPSFAFAQENNEIDEVLNEVNSFSEKYGMTFEELPEDFDGDILRFDSVEEFEEYLADMITEQEKLGIDYKNNTIDIEIDSISLIPNNELEGSQIQSASSLTESSYHWSKYSPYTSFMITGMFCKKHIYFDYKYYFENGKPKFHSVYDIISKASGFNLASWKHTKAEVPKFSSDRSKATITVSGEWILGVAIKGYTIGATDAQDWTMSLTLK